MTGTIAPANSDTGTPLEVLIVGFGAVGIIYGYLLEHKGKANVTAVARSRYNSIIDKGINIQSLRWGQVNSWRPHRVVKHIEDALPYRYDYVLLCTKAVPELHTAADTLEPLLNKYAHPQPTYVILQNGLGIEKELYAALQAKEHPSSILSCAVYVMANVLDNGDVLHVNSDKVVLGVYKPPHSPLTNSPNEQKVLDELVDAMNASNFDASSVSDITAAKFNKNLWNASIGMVCCLTRLTTFEWSCDPKSMDSAYSIVGKMLEEIVIVGRSMGYDESILSSSVVDGLVQFEKARTSSSKASGEFVTSALLDIRAGKPFELDVILGELVRIGRSNQCSIPNLEMVYGMLLPVQAKSLQIHMVRK